MLIPLIALLILFASIVTYALTTNSKLAEIARAAIWTSLFVILYANATMHVIRL